MTGVLSVVTPSYNQARFLQACLDSVRAQGEVVLEHLVMDGGSTDGSVDILRAAKGVRWTSERDAGQSDALNKGLSQVRGEFVGWLNSDDVYLPGAAARAVALLRADPGLGMVFGHCRKIDADGAPIGRVDARDLTLEALLSFGTIPQPSCFLRRSVLEAAGGVDVSYRYAMDYDLWLRLGLRGVRWRAVDEVWAGFRLHGASKSGSDAPRFLPEVERAMEAALASPQLPPWLGVRRPLLRRRFHENVALAAYANLDLPSARRHLYKAALAQPSGVNRPLLGCLAKTLLGQRAIVAARAALAMTRPQPEA